MILSQWVPALYAQYCFLRLCSSLPNSFWVFSLSILYWLTLLEVSSLVQRDVTSSEIWEPICYPIYPVLYHWQSRIKHEISKTNLIFMILLTFCLILQNISVLLICLIYIYFVPDVNQYKALTVHWKSGKYLSCISKGNKCDFKSVKYSWLYQYL